MILMVVWLKQKKIRSLFWQRVRNRSAVIYYFRKALIISIFTLIPGQLPLYAQTSTITFPSTDSLALTADVYMEADTLPFLVMIHEQGSSRGEFEKIAPRFQKMHFNCIAVDIRNGGNANFISNETSRRCRNSGCDQSPESVQGDIKAAVSKAHELSGEKNVILLGSGANGSLCLKVGKEHPDVAAVIALSPGEFFRPAMLMEDTLAGMQKPVFVTSTQQEYPYIEQMLSGIEDPYKTIYKPQEHEGERGTGALEPETPSNSEYWLALILFIKELM